MLRDLGRHAGESRLADMAVAIHISGMIGWLIWQATIVVIPDG